MARQVSAGVAMFLSCTMLLAPVTVAAMSSANFTIPFSVLNNGVGAMSSTNFDLDSSLGEGIAGASSSGSGKTSAPGFINQLFGTVYSCILDVDDSGVIDARTDGLLILRSMFGLTGSAVTSGAIGPQAKRLTFDEVRPLIHAAALDLDGNGQTDPLTDGLMLVRALFGLTGTAVTSNAIGPNATRSNWTAIRNYLNTSCGTTLQ